MRTLILSFVVLPFFSCNSHNKSANSNVLKFEKTKEILNRYDVQFDSTIRMVFEYYKSFDTTYVLYVNQKGADYYATLKIALPKDQYGNNLFFDKNDTVNIYKAMEVKYKISKYLWNSFLISVDKVRYLLKNRNYNNNSIIHPQYYSFYYDRFEVLNVEYEDEYFWRISELIKNILNVKAGT